MCNVNAQNNYNNSFKTEDNMDGIKSIEFKKHLFISNSLKALLVPQFGSLFGESYKQVKGIQNLVNYYDVFDLGLKLGFTYEILSRLNITSVYNLGMLKFNRVEQGVVKGAVMKLSLCYNF
jgi:hypothetical protein